MVPSMIQGSPIRFYVNYDFAEYCLDHIGQVIKHDILGSLFCNEIIMDKHGEIELIIFIGTSSCCKSNFFKK